MLAQRILNPFIHSIKFDETVVCIALWPKYDEGPWEELAMQFGTTVVRGVKNLEKHVKPRCVKSVLIRGENITRHEVDKHWAWLMTPKLENLSACLIQADECFSEEFYRVWQRTKPKLRRFYANIVDFDNEGFAKLCDTMKTCASTLEEMTLYTRFVKDFSPLFSLLDETKALTYLSIFKVPFLDAETNFVDILCRCTSLDTLCLYFDYRNMILQIDMAKLWVYPRLMHFEVGCDIPVSESDEIRKVEDHLQKIDHTMRAKRRPVYQVFYLALSSCSPLAGKVSPDIWSMVLSNVDLN